MLNQSRILIIDDDPLIRLLVSTTLQSIGLQTTEACSGEEGLEYFHKLRCGCHLVGCHDARGHEWFFKPVTTTSVICQTVFIYLY